MRKTWVFVNGEMIPKDEYTASSGDQIQATTFIKDIQPFVSVVDGSLITGRSSLREHNKRNDVVNTAELTGLAPRQAVTVHKNNGQNREALIREFNKRGY